jgi:hypothetical protein
VVNSTVAAAIGTQATVAAEIETRSSLESSAFASTPVPTLPPSTENLEDVEMTPADMTALKQSAAGVEDPFDPAFEDPFAGDPYTGMTAEERADFEKEMVLDPEADKDDNEDGEGGEGSGTSSGNGGKEEEEQGEEEGGEEEDN